MIDYTYCLFNKTGRADQRSIQQTAENRRWIRCNTKRSHDVSMALCIYVRSKYSKPCKKEVFLAFHFFLSETLQSPGPIFSDPTLNLHFSHRFYIDFKGKVNGIRAENRGLVVIMMDASSYLFNVAFRYPCPSSPIKFY